jgi:hypothetical protein
MIRDDRDVIANQPDCIHLFLRHKKNRYITLRWL